MRSSSRRLGVATIATAALLLTAGCSGAGGGSADDGPVELSYWAWAPNLDKVVDLWNQDNPDIQVTVNKQDGGDPAITKLLTAIKAGSGAPDLIQAEYQKIPTLVASDALADISKQGAADLKDDFSDGVWNSVTLGGDAVYAVPQDSGPMAMFYRADLFEQNGIAIPTTWAEYKEAAKKVRATGAYITNFSQGDINQFAGFVWQAGGSWFDNDGSDWTVDLTDPASKKVADYWQDLIDEDLVSTVPTWTTEWDNAYNSSAAWTWNSAVWGANSIASGAPDTAGKWAVAKAPQWEAGDSAAGNWGGSSTAVFTGSKHPYEASKFALWLNTSDEALTMLNTSANIYPATKEGLNLPVLKEGVDFYGGQPIYDVFAEASSEVSEDFAWGPTMTQTYNDVSDGFKAAVSGDGTLLDALTKGQSATIDALKAQSIPVKE